MPEFTVPEFTVPEFAVPEFAVPEFTEPVSAGPESPGPGPTGIVPGSARPGVSRAGGQVGDFHRAYGLPLRVAPTAEVGTDQVALRQALIEEEVGELATASRVGDLVGVADALADIVYVAYGTAHVYGIDLDAVLDEVHASNMTKLGADGRPVRRADGKVLKGPGYRPPDIAAILARG